MSQGTATTSNRLPTHTAPTFPLVPNTPLTFDALINLGIVRGGNGRTARSAPDPIPSSSASDLVRITNDVMSGDEDASAAALSELLSNAGVRKNNDFEVEKDAGPASRSAHRGVQEADGSDDKDAEDDNFDGLSSGSERGRSFSYLETAIRKRTPRLVESAAQRSRIISPRQVAASITTPQVHSDTVATERGAKTFCGDSVRPKRAKAAPAAPEKKKKERKSAKAPRKGLN